MRGQQERTGPLFSYISAEDRIPTSHPQVQVLALLRTLALNLLRSKGFRSIRAGLMAVARDISRMLGWAGISPSETG